MMRSKNADDAFNDNFKRNGWEFNKNRDNKPSDSQTLKLEDLYKFKNVGDAQVSPDDTKVLFVVSQADRGEPWHLCTEQSVIGAPKRAPDGIHIVFTSKVFAKDDNWIPHPGAPKWDRLRAECQASVDFLDSKTETLKKGDNDRSNGIKQKPLGVESKIKVITRLSYRFDGEGYFGDMTSHSHMVNFPINVPEFSEIISFVGRLTNRNYNYLDSDLSPDGKHLVISALRRKDADYVQKQGFWLLEISTGRTVWLIDGTGSIRAPRWSPNGKKIVFLGHDVKYKNSTTTALWVIDVALFVEKLNSQEESFDLKPLSMNNAKNLTKQFDRPIGNYVSPDMRYFSPNPPYFWEDPNTITFLASDQGATGVFRLQIDCNNDKSSSEPLIKSVWYGRYQTVSHINQSRGLEKTVMLQIGSSETPDDLYLFDESAEADLQLTKLTDLNTWLTDYVLGACERFTYKGAKGWDTDGYLVYPVNYTENVDLIFPTVLFIHGGPHGVYGSAFMFQCQIFGSENCAVAVLYTNPRGSQSYGQKFVYACVGDWRDADYLDIMAGIDYVVTIRIADPSRLFVTGWIITQTDRFKAAAAGAIISNWHSMWGTSDIPMFAEHHVGGLPWKVSEKYLERPPISYVPKVTTPVMFIHGDGDLRCPVSQSEEFYLSFRQLGKTAVFVRYPDEFHGFLKPLHRFDRFERMLNWFRYYASGV